jgi:hypothetical protein
VAERVLSTHRDRYPALSAAFAETAAANARDQALGFGRGRILDGVELYTPALRGRQRR